MIGKVCCRLAYDPDFARRNAQLLGQIEDCVERNLLSYVQQYDGHKAQLGEFSTTYDLDGVIRQGAKMYMKIELIIPDRLAFFLRPEEVLKKLRARLQVDFESQIAGHFFVEVVPGRSATAI